MIVKYILVTVQILDKIEKHLVAVTDDNTQISIPSDPLNVDYLQYVAWLFDGNTPEEWNPEQVSEEQ
jgi:hypothetical protein